MYKFITESAIQAVVWHDATIAGHVPTTVAIIPPTLPPDVMQMLCDKLNEVDPDGKHAEKIEEFINAQTGPDDAQDVLDEADFYAPDPVSATDSTVDSAEAADTGIPR